MFRIGFGKFKLEVDMVTLATFMMLLIMVIIAIRMPM